MKSPFPGMDPFLESRWESVHGALATYASEALNRQLPTGLLARSGERSVVTTDDDYRDIIPDVTVFERGLAEPSIVAGGVAVARAVRVQALEYTIKQWYVEIRAARPEGGRACHHGHRVRESDQQAVGRRADEVPTKTAGVP